MFAEICRQVKVGLAKYNAYSDPRRRYIRPLKRDHMNIRMKKILVFCTLGLICWGCNKKSGGTTNRDNFDQAALLTNLSDNLIVPAYTSFSADAEALKTAVDDFVGAPSAGGLSSAQEAFRVAYKSFIHCEPYDFGPANGTVMLQTAVNFWPTDPAMINAELNGSSAISNDYVNGLSAGKKGFPALGYLLFDLTNGNGAVLDSFTTGSLADRRRAYVLALAQNIASNAAVVLQQWQSTYATSFKKNTGTEANTSLSLLLNSLVVGLETSKNKRLGTPIGRKDNFTTGPIDPSAVELPYSNLAKEMLAESAVTLAALYQGKTPAGDGPGFDDYVSSMNDEGIALNDSIKTSLAALQAKIAAIPSPMQLAITSDATPVYNAWVETKKLLVFLKVDLASDLGILITFSDNDGD